jgi:transglutaminase-like putative cysteine protease
MPVKRRAPFLYAAVLFLFPSAGTAGHARPRTLRYGYSVVNTTGRPVEGAVFWAYAPVKRTAAQRCVGITSDRPFDRTEDVWGNQLLRFSLGTVPPFGRADVRVKADMLFSDKEQKTPTARPLLDACRRPERFVESTDPDIVRLAASFRGKKAVSIAEEAFDWVARHVVSESPVAEPRGAADVLSRRKGDCTEAMYLFMALCRASGIPARGVGGYALQDNLAFRTGDYHDWAEFYEGGRWRLSDPGQERFLTGAAQRVAFRVQGGVDGTDFNRFKVVGDGLQASMED